MAQTKAHRRTPQKTYGQQVHRGNIGEEHCSRILKKQGYTVCKTPTHPHGKGDLIARKGKATRTIQVKRISSRTFRTARAARNRMRGKPYNVKRLPAGMELWVIDKEEHLYKFNK